MGRPGLKTMPANESPPTATGRSRSPRLVTAGLVATAMGAAGVGAVIPSLLSGASALRVGAAGGFALLVVFGAGLIRQGRLERVPKPVPLVEPAIVGPDV